MKSELSFPQVTISNNKLQYTVKMYLMVCIHCGCRVGDQNVLILMTDGRSNIQQQNTIPAAEAAKRNSRVIVVGLGEGNYSEVITKRKH